MAYYVIQNGRREPATGSAIKSFARYGTIVPDTVIEFNGKRYPAKAFKELAAIFAQRERGEGDRFLFFDAETPNSFHDRICAFGLVLDDDSEPVYTLVNPGVKFDRVNTSIHGIRERDVVSAPKFLDVWERVRELFETRIVVGYNVTFDLLVLEKTLASVGVALPPVRYVDVFEAAKRVISPPYQLEQLCARLRIPLERHHNAESDAVAAKELFKKMPKSSLRVRDFSAADVKKTPKLANRTDATKLIDGLRGLLYGVASDDVVVEAEKEALRNWIKENEYFRDAENLVDVFAAVERLIAAPNDDKETINDVVLEVDAAAFDYECGTEAQSLRTLSGFVRGIVADGELNNAEILDLSDILRDWEHKSRPAEAEQIFELSRAVLLNDANSENARKELFDVLQKFLNPIDLTASSETVTINGNTFVLTGDFRDPKDDVKELIIDRGGQVRTAVSRKTNYLVVGAPSPQWKCDQGGQKILSARKIQAEGGIVKIVTEEALYSALEN